MILNLRPYQREAVDAIESAWSAGMRRPACVLPTGAGKTVVFAHGAAEWLQIDANARSRVLVLAHRTELIEQAASKLRAVAPDLRVGVVKAERNDTLARVIVASVQTLANERRRRMLRDVGMIIVDECHHAVAKSYIDILDHYGALSDEPRKGGAVAVGFTATMTRGDDKALGKIWQDVVYQRSIAEMIRDGFLVRPRGRRVLIDDFDLRKIKKSRGDYSEAALGEALEAALAPEAVARAYVEHCADRPGLAFWPTVETAQHAASALNDVGIVAGVVWGAQPAAERAAVLQDFVDGKVQVICNCMVLTEGTDLPLAEVAVIARPTTHAGLYLQMVGRVLRPWLGKVDALVLDVVGAAQKHSLHARVDLFGEDDQLTEREPVDDDEESADPLELADALDDVGPEWRDGPLTSVEIDLFKGSDSAWLVTRGGTWFLPAGERYIAIVPALGVPGAWDVTAMHRYHVGTGRRVASAVPDKAYAMAWAEQDVTVAEAMTARKERSWRARRPSQKQIDLARRYGVIVHDRMLSGEVSNSIAVAMASARIDPRVSAWMGR